MNSVNLVTVTPEAEATMGYVARVSNPANQENPNVSGLLKYCIKHGHWSVFEQAHMTLEINTTRGIAVSNTTSPFVHISRVFQRYAEVGLLDTKIEVPELRRQDTKNRQNSTADLPPGIVKDYQAKIAKHFEQAQALYQQLLDVGVAKECARFVLPLAVPTRIYMTGSVRSWIHYIDLRSAHGTQKEHMDIANDCKRVFIEQFPIVSEALEWL